MVIVYFIDSCLGSHHHDCTATGLDAVLKPPMTQFSIPLGAQDDAGRRYTFQCESSLRVSNEGGRDFRCMFHRILESDRYGK